MKEPISVTVAAAGAAGAAAAGLGTFAGLPIEALLFGFIGGVVAVLIFPPQVKGRTPLARCLAIVGYLLAAVLTAAALGPISAAYLHVEAIDPRLELRAACFLWGIGLQALLPALINAARNRIRQAGGLQATEDNDGPK